MLQVSALFNVPKLTIIHTYSLRFLTRVDSRHRFRILDGMDVITMTGNSGSMSPMNLHAVSSLLPYCKVLAKSAAMDKARNFAKLVTVDE